MENISETQVTQVGFDFIPSSETNAEINRLMGYESGVYGGKVLRRSPDDIDAEWEDSPDYINDDAATLELLEEAGMTIFVLPTHTINKRTQKLNKKKTEWLGVFSIGEEMYVTVPMEKEEHVAACIWWFMLSLCEYVRHGDNPPTIVRIKNDE